ncbi:unnamed protein product [Effrenium voratum]|nr:unnamed protein product [Effrenium voratum]
MDPLAAAVARFGYTAGQLPEPQLIQDRCAALAAAVRQKLAEGEEELQQQLQDQREQLQALQMQQQMRFKLALDCRVKAQEYSLSKRHNEQLMQLQQHSQARRAQLEQQATSLILEFQQRKLQEEFLVHQKEIHEQHQDAQHRQDSDSSQILPVPGGRLAMELKKLGAGRA